MSPMEKAGRNPVPLSLIEDRRQFAIDLLKSGLSRATILKKVNELDSQKNWGAITMRTLQRDICAYYSGRDYGSVGTEMVEARAMREVHIAQLESTMELLRMEIAERDKTGSWRRNERTKAITSLFKMQRDYGDIQGFHINRMQNPYSPNSLSSSKNMHTLYEHASIENMRLDSDAKQLLVEGLRYAAEKKFKKKSVEQGDGA